MNETRKTLGYAAMAVVILLITVFTMPKQVTPDAFSDIGEEFFPDFTDPNAARTLEVIEFDEQTGSARPFKVTFHGGRWTIPSHYDYPADGKDRLAETAAGLIGIKKEDFRTDNVADYAACGVIDPLDESVVELHGRGKRVTIKGENDVVLADLIIGKTYEDRENFHLVRIPDHKRVYGSLINIDISTKFSDWIESDLLKVEKEQIRTVVLKDYSIDEKSKRLNERDVVVMHKGEDDTWSADDTSPDKEVDRYKVNNFLRALDELSIVGVRPKPEGLTASLTTAESGMSISTGDMLSLQSKGFYFLKDGRLASNEGELQVTTKEGVTYTLRFGEIVYGTGVAVSAGGQSQDQAGPGENRYLFITTAFDETLFPEPEKPANTDFLDKPDSTWTAEDHYMKGLQADHDKWKNDVERGRQLSDALNARFAGWYYVISAESYDKVHVKRADLLKDKPKPKTD